MRKFNLIDKFISEGQHMLDSLRSEGIPSRENPAKIRVGENLDPADQRQSQGFIRVNHTGEICAQALYRGQALATKNPELHTHLQDAAIEETDHLIWCKERLNELDTHASYLNPLWYMASFLIGFGMAKRSDAISLGFVEETEAQVVRHLEHHQQHLSTKDHKSRAIIALMREDERKHGEAAREQGAAALSDFIKLLMKYQAKVMTTTAYYI